MQKRIRRRVWREMDVNEGERLRGEEEGSKKNGIRARQRRRIKTRKEEGLKKGCKETKDVRQEG